MGIRPVREQLPSPTATAWPAPESSVLRAVPRTISCGELHGELHDTMCWVRAQWNAGATDVRRAETGFGAAQMDCTVENRCRESLVKHKAWQARTHRAESSRHPRKGFSPAHRLPTCCERRSGMIFPTSGLSGGGMSSYAAACGCGRPIRDPRCARGASTSTSRRLRRRRGAAPRQQSVQSCTRWPRSSAPVMKSLVGSRGCCKLEQTVTDVKMQCICVILRTHVAWLGPAHRAPVTRGGPPARLAAERFAPWHSRTQPTIVRLQHQLVSMPSEDAMSVSE